MRFRPAKRVVVVCTIWVAITATYLIGYFVRGETFTVAGVVEREFATEAERALATPIAAVESYVRQRDVEVIQPGTVMRTLDPPGGLGAVPFICPERFVGTPTRSEATNQFWTWLDRDDRRGHIMRMYLDADHEVTSFMWNICAYADHAMLEQIFTLKRLQSLDILLARGVDLAALDGLRELRDLKTVTLHQHDESISRADFEELQRRVPQAKFTRTLYLVDPGVPISMPR